MSRVLKFRAWDYFKKVMYLDALKIEWMEAGTFVMADGFRGLLGPVTLLQFTGLLDRHGKEIYEGDVLKVDDERDEGGEQFYHSVVRYEDGAFLVDVRGQDHDQTALGWAIQEEWFAATVLGNIYEHPHLLTGGH